MRMRWTFLLLLLTAFLVACGGEEEPVATPEPTVEATKPAEPTAEPVPTSEPAPTDEPTAPPIPTDEPTLAPTEEPTVEMTMADGVELAENVRIEEAGVAVRIPSGYSVQVSGDTAELAPPDAVEPTDGAFTVGGGPYDEDETFEWLQDGIFELLAEFDDVSEAMSFEGAAGDAFAIDFTLEENGMTLSGRAIVIDNGTQGAALFGFAGGDEWPELVETFDAIARSAEFFEPLVTAETPSTDDGGEVAQTDNGEQPAPEVVTTGEAGMACFSARGDGLTCLMADGSWQVITEENSQIGGDYVTAMADCNGTILMAHLSGLSRFDGATWREYNDGWGFSTPEDLACDAKDGIWVAHFDGVSYSDGSAWTTFESANVLGGESLVYSVEVAADGTVWVLTSGSLASYDGSAWTTYTDGDGLDDTYFFDAMALSADGTPYAAHSDGVLYLSDGVWLNIESPSYLSPEAIALDGEGNQWVGTFDDGIVVFEGPTTSTIDRTNGLSSNGVGAMAVDGSGRLWVGTEYGLNVWDGETWVVYNMDNSDLASNNVEVLTVLGDGPMLPEQVDKANGGLVGSVVEAGEPLVDKVVELCVEALYSSFDGATPCETQPFSVQTTTDADGAFIFEDVPVGNYVIVVETSDGWARLTTDFGFGSEFTPVSEGETTDVGELLIEVEE